MRKAFCSILLLAFVVNSASAGISIIRSNGITVTGADGISYLGPSGITVTGADGFLNTHTNGITVTGADGIMPISPNGATYTGPNGITVTGADGITVTGADGATLTGPNGITVTGADGTPYTANSIILNRPNGITVTGADGITVTGADGITVTGADGATRVGPNGITVTGADGITVTGADGVTSSGVDGITVTGADSITGLGPNGVLFERLSPAGITVTGADGITVTGADGSTVTAPTGISMIGVDGVSVPGSDDTLGLQSVDPELAVRLNEITDDSSVNAVIVYHQAVRDTDIAQLQQLGIVGGTRFRVLPMIYVTATRGQLIAVSRLPNVRSLYGNRTLTFNSDPYFNSTGVQRVTGDDDLRTRNASLPVTGRNVTVAVLDTGINAQHPDLTGRVIQNVRLTDTQSIPAGFVNPIPVENLPNTDLAGGHGTFVGGIIAASGQRSGGKYAGVATGSKLLGLSAGDANLTHVLSGFDYLLDKGSNYGVRVVNCSFSSAAVFDLNDPVNVATKMLTDAGVNVVFSAGNSGPGNGTLNPYAAAPWVVGVGASDTQGRLATYSSRGNFGDPLQHPTLVAPGTSIASLRSGPTVTGISGLAGADAERLTMTEMPYYTTGTGTSFSAPQVAGAIALMLEANPNLTPEQVKDILARTATPLPKYFYHEAGAGVLNTYAAVLESAFPDRRMGAFRSLLLKNSVKFITETTQTFQQTIYPHLAVSTGIAIPPDTLQASVNVAWSLSTNDFGLKLYDSENRLIGESNSLNVPGITGRREKIVVRNPSAQTLRSEVRHTGYVGTAQPVIGAVEITRVEFPQLTDIGELAPPALADAQSALVSSLILPDGRRFNPGNSVMRGELADTILRSGLVPQYMAQTPMYLDVRDRYVRNAVESVQSNPSGRLFIDAPAGGRFNPYNGTSRLVAAIALVKAAGLEGEAATAALPIGVADAFQIPTSLRGYVAVAIQKGYISLDGGNRFSPYRSLTRIEMAHAITTILR